MMTTRTKGILVAAGLACAALAFFFGLASRGSAVGHARPAELPSPAVGHMSAVAASRTTVPVSAAPSIPADLAPANGQIHKLLTHGNASLFAWSDGERICHTSSDGLGGCFSNFVDSFNYTLNDPDELGSGQPLVVSGFVPDGVVGVDVTVQGTTYPADVKNNAVYFALPSAAQLPSAVEAFTVRFANGGTKVIPHDAIPAS